MSPGELLVKNYTFLCYFLWTEDFKIIKEEIKIIIKTKKKFNKKNLKFFFLSKIKKKKDKIKDRRLQTHD